MDLLLYTLIGLVMSVITSKLGGGSRGVVLDTIIGAYGAHAFITLVSVLGLTFVSDFGTIGTVITGALGTFVTLHLVKSLKS